MEIATRQVIFLCLLGFSFVKLEREKENYIFVPFFFPIVFFFHVQPKIEASLNFKKGGKKELNGNNAHIIVVMVTVEVVICFFDN